MSTAETPAALLRRAAEHLRALAAEATPGRWALDWHGQELQLRGPGQEYPYSVAEWTYAVATWEPDASVQRAECDTADQRYMVAMYPGVGAALAGWLEQAADAFEGVPVPDGEPALRVARAVLGEVAE